MVRVSWAVVFGVALLATTPVRALVVWGGDASGSLTGSRSSSTGGGVTATEEWAGGGFVISWDIQKSGGAWTYNYLVSVDQGAGKIKDVSHFILEVTDDGQPFSILSGTSTPREGPQTWSGGQGNPGLPNAFYGVKFDFGTDKDAGVTTANYTIVTDRAPIWGVFYAKDGKSGGNDVVAYAAALADPGFQTSHELVETDFIVRPDGQLVVPLPLGFWLLGAGLLGYFGLGRARKAA